MSAVGDGGGRDEQATDALTSGGGQAPDAVEVHVDGPGGRRVHLWTKGLLVVGSGSDCDLVLDDRAVSRKHLAAELEGGKVKVKDLGSRNGVVYQGARVTEARLPFGAIARLGKTQLRFLLPVPEGQASRTHLGPLLGRSAPMQKLYTALEGAAGLRTPVLLRGETGVGKGLVARTLHGLGACAQEPFVVLDCAAVSPSLVESELFGHAKGAFTGALSEREGLAAAAKGGTLFLDEVGELPPPIQVKLLRVVETRRFRPVGDALEREGSFRIVAATHVDLEAAVREGRFRADLYHRLAATELWVPPLRARLEDIPLLVERFTQDWPGAAAIDPLHLAALQAAQWPGNVRELKNAVERLLALPPEGLAPGAAPGQGERGYAETRDAVMEQFERAYLEGLLRKHQQNASSAAREAKVARSHFYRLLERHGLSRRDSRSQGED